VFLVMPALLYQLWLNHVSYIALATCLCSATSTRKWMHEAVCSGLVTWRWATVALTTHTLVFRHIHIACFALSSL
jgi:hypothetical protein